MGKTGQEGTSEKMVEGASPKFTPPKNWQKKEKNWQKQSDSTYSEFWKLTKDLWEHGIFSQEMADTW